MINFFRAKPPRAPLVSLDRRVRQLEIVTARLVREGFAGQYHSAFHGRGLEFSQVREYQPGDDIRTIDWNVTARTSVPHVKEFIEERDLTLLLALDVSASMHFGSLDKRKSELAAELVAVLSYAALRNNDRVGIVTFSDRVEKFVAPNRGRRHALHVIRTAVAATPRRSKAAIAPLARFAENVFRRRAVLVVLSDFLEMPLGRDFARLTQQHDVVAMKVSDPREMILPKNGMVRLCDAESGSSLLVDLGSKAGRETMLRRRQMIDAELKRSHADVLELSTAAPFDRVLIDFFEKRGVRRR